jgi:formylglycine-generating enzyme required for sulfatase activity
MTIVAFSVMILGLIQSEWANAQDIEELKKGVVKILATPPGESQRGGTGFIVRLKKDAAYIVTAAHVVEGDPTPKVSFFPDATKFVEARVLGIEGGDENGLAALVVEQRIPSNVQVLCFEEHRKVSEGASVTAIGFPIAAATPWMVTQGTLSGRRGSMLTFAGIVDSGNSGGPLFIEDRVVGVITAMQGNLGYAVPMVTAKFALEGWGVRLPELALCLRREIVGRDGAPMMLIPAGEFWMGSPEGEGKEDERPRHQVFLDAFYMDKFEVTVLRYDQFMQSTDRAKPMDWNQVDVTTQGKLPVVGVEWNDADTYCRWAGKRLPTEAEWEKAARGTDGRTYPWGNEEPTARLANFGRQHSPTVKTYEDTLVPVDHDEAGQSPYGLHHMAGNVFEWVWDWYEERYYRRSPARNPKGPSHGTMRVFRGGSLYNDPADVRSANRHRFPSSTQLVSLGFRCAQDGPK